MKKYLEWVFTRWRPIVAGVVALTITVLLLEFRLGSLVRGVSTSELQYLHSLRAGKQLLQDPVFLPHKLLTYIIFKFGIHGIAPYRFVSGVFAALAIASGFLILKSWYSLRVALLGTVLLMSSPWLLHIGRLAVPEASFLLVMPLLLAAMFLHTTKRHRLAVLSLATLSPICLYIPGFLWLAAVLFIWQRRAIWAATKAVPWWYVTINGLILALGTVPFIMGILHDMHLVLAVLGLPLRVPNVAGLAKNLVHIPLQLFVKGPADPVRWLGRLPILDIFSTIMFTLGLYSLRYRLRLGAWKYRSIFSKKIIANDKQLETALYDGDHRYLKLFDGLWPKKERTESKKNLSREQMVRSQLFLGCLVIMALLVTTGGLVTISAIIPLTFVLVAAGIAFMLQQWFTVFPRNPLARGIATTLMSITVALVCFYNLNHYFIAWPQTPATKHVFNLKL